MIPFEHFLLTCLALTIVVAVLGVYLWEARANLKGMTRSRDHWEKIVKEELTNFGNMFENVGCSPECSQYHSPECPRVKDYQDSQAEKSE